MGRMSHHFLRHIVSFKGLVGVIKITGETESAIRSEIAFLLTTAKNLLKSMEDTLAKKEYETYLRAYKQFHRVIGEIFALKRIVAAYLRVSEELIQSIDILLTEVERLLEKAGDLEEEFLKALSKL